GRSAAGVPPLAGRDSLRGRLLGQAADPPRRLPRGPSLAGGPGRRAGGGRSLLLPGCSALDIHDRGGVQPPPAGGLAAPPCPRDVAAGGGWARARGPAA